MYVCMYVYKLPIFGYVARFLAGPNNHINSFNINVPRDHATVTIDTVAKCV